eukprot:GHVS01006900.1.p1 GENE.GHVS01006900.1~~GHVS01006900.1.p1  ORF type:complete len:205 (-),score=17.79 GHVS01006900.1:384-953(-)
MCAAETWDVKDRVTFMLFSTFLFSGLVTYAVGFCWKKGAPTRKFITLCAIITYFISLCAAIGFVKVETVPSMWRPLVIPPPAIAMLVGVASYKRWYERLKAYRRTREQTRPDPLPDARTQVANRQPPPPYYVAVNMPPPAVDNGVTPPANDPPVANGDTPPTNDPMGYESLPPGYDSTWSRKDSPEPGN